MTTPLIDLTRFPGRGWYAGIAEQIRAAPAGSSLLNTSVLARWAQHLRARPADILLLATAQEAIRVAIQALVVPSDVVLLARPLPPEWLMAVLHAGARYLDVGRRFDGPTPTGGLNHAAAHRAALAHPQAIAIAELATWSGANDAALAADLPIRGVIVDARRHADCLGPQLPGARAPLTLVALRDPDRPSEPVLYALLVPDQQGEALLIASGPTALPEIQAEHAFAVLDGLQRQPTWPTAMQARLATRYAQFQQAVANRPGVVLLGQTGLEAAALCLADDGEEIAQALAGEFPAAVAWPMTDMRGLLTVDLLR